MTLSENEFPLIEHFEGYPDDIRPKLLRLRAMIFQLAEALSLGEVEETLKWGEPSYKVKTGSPIRLDWKPSSPNNYYVFFHCQTKLVDTFRQLYDDELEFQGNRAIVLDVSSPIPEDMLKHCLTLALTYQQVKHLPLLGA